MMAHDVQPMLDVSDLTVTIEDQAVLSNLSFDVQQGDVLTILGPNGAGKTVLLRALLGTLPHEGLIEWEKGVRIGYVPQRLPYIKDIPLSVAEFFALKKNGMSDAGALLHAVGLGPEFGKKRPGEFPRSVRRYHRQLLEPACCGFWP